MRGDNVGITARRSRSATAAATSMALQSPVSSCIAYFRSPRALYVKNIFSMRASVSRLCFCGHSPTLIIWPKSFATFLRRGDLGLRIATCCGCVMGSRMLTNI